MAARFAQGFVLPLNLLPPETLFPGQRPNHEAKCLEFRQQLISNPISDINVSAVLAPMDGILVKSTPVLLISSERTSN